MRILVLISFILVTNFIFAQQDSLYIKPFEQQISIKAFSTKKFVFLMDENKDDIKNTYKPNNPFEIGLGLSINNTVLSFSYGYGFSFMRDKNKGKTKSFDFQYHNYGSKYVFDFFYQKYKGFYLDDEDSNKKIQLSSSLKDDSSKDVQLFPDLTVESYQAIGQYIFNNKKFSYKAAYVQNERQLKSAGSFMLGGSISYIKIKSDSLFLFEEKKDLTNFQFGVNVGYSYTWVIKKNYFVNGSVTAGLNIGNDGLDRLFKDRIRAYPSVFPRVSAGYNTDKWSLGFSFLGNVIYPYHSKNKDVGLMSGNFQLTYTQRFDNIPIISKIMEYLPF